MAQTNRSALVYCLDEAVVSAGRSKFISRALGGIFHQQNVLLLVEDVAGLKKNNNLDLKLLQDNKDKEKHLISLIVKGEKNRPNKLLVQNFQTVSHQV